jgi:hypothetical protein
MPKAVSLPAYIANETAGANEIAGANNTAKARRKGINTLNKRIGIK